MSAIIEIKELTKFYGLRKAVDNLNLAVEEGEIFGFVGPNGAGKTSTIRIMSTLLPASKGDILVNGHSVRTDPRGVRRSIGYMPDFFGVYNDMLVWEYLDFFAACYKIPPPARPGLINDLLELVDLGHRRDDPVEGLSRGMKQRLSIARTLIHDPQVLILDEPASGLDPRARVEIRNLMVQLAEMGKTIFFSTHILADVAEICNSVGIIEAGELVASGSLDELQKILVPQQEIQLTLLSKGDEAEALLRSMPGVSEIRLLNGNNSEGRIRLTFDFSGDDRAISGVLAALVGAGIPVLHFNSDTRDMEEVFMRATKGLVS